MSAGPRQVEAGLSVLWVSARAPNQSPRQSPKSQWLSTIEVYHLILWSTKWVLEIVQGNWECPALCSHSQIQADFLNIQLGDKRGKRVKRVCLLLKSLGLEEIHSTSTHIPLMKTHHVTSALQDTRDIWSLTWWQLSDTNSILWVERTNPWWTASYLPPSLNLIELLWMISSLMRYIGVQ